MAVRTLVAALLTIGLVHAAATPPPRQGGRVSVTAIIIDPKLDELLVHSLEHFVVMLPREVRVHWLTDHELGADERTRLRASDVLGPALQAGKLVTRKVDYKLTRAEYNEQLRQPAFWEALLPTEQGHVLLFERDAVLCPGAATKLSNFTQFDFVGAPWRPSVPWCHGRRLGAERCCCNSGLSLSQPRKVAQLLRRARQHPHHNRFHPVNVDMFVLEYAADMPAFRKAPASSAQRFAVETVWDGRAVPLGVHKPWFGWGHAAWGGSKMQIKRLVRSCPAVLTLCPYAHRAAGNPAPDHGLPAQRFVQTFCQPQKSGQAGGHGTTPKALFTARHPAAAAHVGAGVSLGAGRGNASGVAQPGAVLLDARVTRSLPLPSRRHRLDSSDSESSE